MNTWKLGLLASAVLLNNGLMSLPTYACGGPCPNKKVCLVADLCANYTVSEQTAVCNAVRPGNCCFRDFDCDDNATFPGCEEPEDGVLTCTYYQTCP